MDEDFLLIQKMKMGDDAAFDTFIRKYYPRILQYLSYHINPVSYAEDLTQDTFVKFFRNFSRYRHYGHAANYLYVIAGNLCRDYYKKAKELSIENIPEPVSDDTLSYEQNISIRMAFDSLEDDCREAAILYFRQELKMKEIAKILGIGLPLVKYRIRKAREQLKMELREEDGNEYGG